MKSVAIAICIVLISSSAFAKPKKLKKFKTKEALCAYIEEKKDNAEERMLRGYTVKQYNKLEANRKYWKNKYIENCF
jgi:hypothetical protein